MNNSIYNSPEWREEQEYERQIELQEEWNDEQDYESEDEEE